MKRTLAIAALVLSSYLVGSSAYAAETMSGMIKKVDGAAHTITFQREGTQQDQVLAVDQAVDLKSVKTNAKAKLTVDAGVVKEIKSESKTRAAGY